MSKKIYKILSLLLCLCLIFEQTGFTQTVGQLDIAGYLTSLHNNIAQDKCRPLHLRYLAYDTLNNNFSLLVDKGSNLAIEKNSLEDTAKSLMNYFFVGLSLPNDSFWVNLRPDAETDIIDDELAKTDIGRIMLEADVQLKKDTARYTSPNTPEGKEYWDKLYQKAGEIFGYDNIEIPTLTRPWIVPDEVLVGQTKDGAYIFKATLKVMLEQDYLKDSAVYNFSDERLKALNEYSSQLIRKFIIPKITREINTSKRYASLRQVYYSLILAQWFKQRFPGRGGYYSRLINARNLTGLTSKVSWSKTTYFAEYQKSFKNGEYNTSESVYTPYGQTIRNYFSGGIKLAAASPVNDAFPVDTIPSGNLSLKYNGNSDKLEAGEPVVQEHINTSSPAQGGKIETPPISSSPLKEFDALHNQLLGIDVKEQNIREIIEVMHARFGGVGASGFSRNDSVQAQGELLLELVKQTIRTKKTTGHREIIFAEIGIGIPPREMEDVVSILDEAFKQTNESPLRWDIKFYVFDNFPEMRAFTQSIFAKLLKSDVSLFKMANISIQFAEADCVRQLGFTDAVNQIMSGRKADFILQRSLTYSNRNAKSYLEPYKDVITRGPIMLDSFAVFRAYLATRNILLACAKPGSYYLLEPTVGFLAPGNDDTPVFGFPGLRLLNLFEVFPEPEKITWLTKDSLGARGTGLYQVTNPSEILTSESGRNGLIAMQESIRDTIPGQPMASSPAQEIQASSPLITETDEPGGIDFRALPIVTQAMSNLSVGISNISLSKLNGVDLKTEWQEIEKLVQSRVSPSGERIKEYLQASCYKGKALQDKKRVISCISDIMRLQEEYYLSTEPVLRDILVALESGRSAEELRMIFIGVKP